MPVKLLDYDVRLDAISEGYDRETEWFQPRIGIIPTAESGALLATGHTATYSPGAAPVE
ncbi:MAG: hypothetical protein ACLFU7_14250 [Armatimonadota bacterium]